MKSVVVSTIIELVLKNKETALSHLKLKLHFHLTLMMTSAHVVKTSVTVTNKIPFQDSPHPDDHTKLLTFTPRFKPFTVLA